MRTLATGPIQRFDWPGSKGGRFQPGFDCWGHQVGVGSEDGHVYLFDARRALAYVDKLAAVPKGSQSTAKSPVTDVAFQTSKTVYAATLDGKLFVYG